MELQQLIASDPVSGSAEDLDRYRLEGAGSVDRGVVDAAGCHWSQAKHRSVPSTSWLAADRPSPDGGTRVACDWKPVVFPAGS